MSRAWIAFYMGDYQKDTNSLTTLEHGAYFLLLNECWQHGRIPVEPHKRAAVAKLTLKEWKKIAPSIDPFFNEDGTNKRATREIEKAEHIRLKRAIAGQRGGVRSGISKAIAKGMDSKYEANANQTMRQRVLQNRTSPEPNHNSKLDSSLGTAREEGRQTPQVLATSNLVQSLERLHEKKQAQKASEAPQGPPEEGRFWIDEGTPEWNAHAHHAQSRGIRPRLAIEMNRDGVIRRGANFDLLVPIGYDEATGEKLQGSSEENAA